MAVVLINPFMGVIKTRQGESKLRRVPPCCFQRGDAANLDAGERVFYAARVASAQRPRWRVVETQMQSRQVNILTRLQMKGQHCALAITFEVNNKNQLHENGKKVPS